MVLGGAGGVIGAGDLGVTTGSKAPCSFNMLPKFDLNVNPSFGDETNFWHSFESKLFLIS